MLDEQDFSSSEMELINAVKKTLKIMAKVIKDRNPGEVIKDVDPRSVLEENEFIADIIIKTNFMERLKDFDPDSESENDNLAILVDELTTVIKEEDPSHEIGEEKSRTIIKNLARAIRERVTPDIPGLNPKDEGAMVGQLGPSIFALLTAKEE